MTNTDPNTAPQRRRKTAQAIKVSAQWTPGDDAAEAIRKAAFGDGSPIRVRGGRLTINAAIATDFASPGSIARAGARVQEIARELREIGTVHSLSTQAGAVALELCTWPAAEGDEGDDPKGAEAA